MLSVAELVDDDLRPKQRALLDAIAESGSITAACKRIGIHRDTVYGWLDAEKRAGVEPESPPAASFTYALRRAKHASTETLIGALHERALDPSTGMPGVVSGIFLIKGQREEYRDNQTVTVKGTIWHANVDLGTLSDQDRAQLLSLAAERATLRLNPAPDTPPTDE